MSLRVDNLRVYYRTLRGDVQAVDGTTFAVRALPRHPDLADPMSSGCITWSE